VTSLAAATPVLVGAGAVSERATDPSRVGEPLALMQAALERAAEDAGSRALLARADSIRAARGFWSYPDPCRLLAERFGAARARTEIAEIGVLQTTPLGRAAADIAAGRADVVLVTAGEARRRAQRAKAAGGEALLTQQAPTTPDCVLRPHGKILTEAELRAGLGMPVSQYAMIENALRAALGQSLAEHRAGLAALQAELSKIAAGNPDAWFRDPVDADAIADPRRNPMLAFPYGKLHCSNWNVDQAAGFVLCSVATARALGIPRARWIFPLAVADANQMLPLSERGEPARCAGFARAAERALERAGRRLEDVAHRELYSCFPSAVRVQQRELGIRDERPVSVTGGMAFAGGPLNHFAFQALARMVGVLRADPGSAGLVTAVSGMLMKQGVSLWSSEPAAAGFAHDDVSEATARDTRAVTLVPVSQGPARVAAYTVLYEGAEPKRTVLLCDREGGGRLLVVSEDAALAQRATQQELCSRDVQISADGGVSWL